LRVVEELGDPATILQAMKDRDAAAVALSEAEAKKVAPKQLYAECQRRARAQDTQARLRELKDAREAKESREAARVAEEQAEDDEDDEAMGRAGAALRALGEGLQRISQPQSSPSPPVYTTPVYTTPPLAEPLRTPMPVDRCSQCIQQWCSFECSGIGNACAPCMTQWCDFEC
jgi:hypothetical protein